MKTLLHWAKSIRGRWRSARAGFALLAAATVLGAATPPAADLALLRAGIAEQGGIQGFEPERMSVALGGSARTIESLRVADYIAYSLAAAEFDLNDFDAAIRELGPVWTNVPPSPLSGEAALVAARAQKQSGRPAGGIDALREFYARLPQPAGDTLLAECYRASADLPSAAVFYQQVYYQYPLSAEANEAAAALPELKATLGDLYPPPTTQAMFERAARLAHGGDFRRARAEYRAMLPAVGGVDRELVRVRLGELDYLSGQTSAAYTYFRSLDVSTPEADSERLYYMAEAARRLDQDDRLAGALRGLDRYADSPWRLKALVSAGNRYLVENRSADYLPVYRACFESFTGPQADYFHWKVAWYAYLHRQPDAAGLLREHLLKYPGSDHAAAALYFLGRLSEAAADMSAAKTFYAQISDRYPNLYYADLADARAAQPAIFGVPDSAAVRVFLKTVVWPVPQFENKFDPTPATQALSRAPARQEPGAGIRLDSGRGRARKLLAHPLSPALEDSTRAVREATRAGPLHGGGPDPPGIRVQPGRGLGSAGLRPDADSAIDRPHVAAGAPADLSRQHPV